MAKLSRDGVHFDPLTWPPPVYVGEPGERGDDPINIHLVRFENDRALRGRCWIECCACGFTHLHTFEVLHSDGGWWIKARAYGVPDTWPDPAPRKRKRGPGKKRTALRKGRNKEKS